MDSIKTIRAVERAFQLLEALNTFPSGATLAQLESATPLSKPTLMRLLKTLIGVGAVRRGMVDQRYRTAIQLDVLARGSSATDRLADLAAPVLDNLCRELEWPSDLLTHTGNEDFMTVQESSLRASRYYVRRRPGKLRVTLLGSAAGNAYLAALTPARRKALVAALRDSTDAHNSKILAAGTWREHLEASRQQGYALRHPLYRGGSFNGVPRSDSLQALAVAVVSEGAVIAALNVNWNRKAIPEDEMVRRSTPRLLEAAEAIASAAQRHGLSR